MSNLNDIGIRISLIGGKAAAEQTAAVAGSIDSVAASATAATPGVTTLAAGLDLLSTSSKGVVDSTIGEDAALGGLSTSLADVGLNTQIVLLQTDRLMASLGAETVEIDAGTSSLATFGGALTTVGIQSGAAASKMASFGKLALPIILAIGTVWATKMAVTFSHATAAVAASADISIAKAQAIGNAFIHTAGQTTFSAQEMMTAFAPVAGQLSTLSGKALTTAQSLTFMSAAGNLATAANTDLGSATTSLSSIMQVYGFNIDKTRYASNLLFNVSGLTNESLSSISSTVARLHARLGQVMPSLKDTSALVLDLAHHGALGARGTMYATEALSTLLSGSKSVNSMLEVLGLTANSFIGPGGKFIGMANAIALLQPELEKLPVNIQILAEKQLFGAGAAQLMGKTVLAGVGAYNKASASVSRYGAVNAAAQKELKSVDGQMKVITSAFKDFMLMIGNFVLPKLVALGTFLIKHKPILEAIAFVVGVALVDAFVSWIIELGAATIMVAAMWVAATGGTIIAVAAIIAGITWLVHNWHKVWTDIKNWVVDAWHFIDNILHNNFVQMILLPIAPLLVLAMHWKTVWNGIKSVVKDVWDFIRPIVDKIIFAIKNIGKVAHGIGHFFSGLFSGAAHMLGFAKGGVVPGPQGAPTIALVHGGEVIVPPSNVYNSSSVSPTMLGMAANRLAPIGAATATVPSTIIGGQGGSGGQPILVQLVLNRKVLAEAMYKQMSQDVARL